MGSELIIPQQNWVHAAALAYGVTTVHDPSNDTFEIFAASEYQKAGQILGPRIFSTGTILYGATTPFTVEVNSLDDARVAPSPPARRRARGRSKATTSRGASSAR